MADLTKKDVVEAVTEVLVVSLPNLLSPFAGAIQKDFQKIDERFNKIDERFNKIDERFNKIDEKLIKIDDDVIYIHSRLDLIERELSDIKKKLENVVYRHEFDQLKERITEIERTVGIKK